MSLHKLALAAAPSVWERIDALRIRSVDVLAPQMRVRLLATLHECEGITVQVPDGTDPDSLVDEIPLDVMAFETLRTDELQGIYFQHGTTKARTARYSWHYYALASDNISKQYEWFTGAVAKQRWPHKAVRERVAQLYFTRLAEVAERNGLKSGARWRAADYPHLYFGTLKDTPSDLARSTYDRAFDAAKRALAKDDAAHLAGRQAVWRIVSAV